MRLLIFKTQWDTCCHKRWLNSISVLIDSLYIYCIVTRKYQVIYCQAVLMGRYRHVFCHGIIQVIKSIFGDRVNDVVPDQIAVIPIKGDWVPWNFDAIWSGPWLHLNIKEVPCLSLKEEYQRLKEKFKMSLFITKVKSFNQTVIFEKLSKGDWVRICHVNLLLPFVLHVVFVQCNPSPTSFSGHTLMTKWLAGASLATCTRSEV